MVPKTIKRIEGMTDVTKMYATDNLSPVIEVTLKSWWTFSTVARTKMNKIVQMIEYLSVSLEKKVMIKSVQNYNYQKNQSNLLFSTQDKISFNVH